MAHKICLFILISLSILIGARAHAAGEIVIGSGLLGKNHGRVVLLEAGGVYRAAVIENVDEYVGGIKFFPRAWLLEARVFQPFDNPMANPPRRMPAQTESIFLKEPISIASGEARGVKIHDMLEGEYANGKIRIEPGELVGYMSGQFEYRMAFVVQIARNGIVELVDAESEGYSSQFAYRRPLKVFYRPANSLFLAESDSKYLLMGFRPDFLNYKSIRVEGTKGSQRVFQIYEQAATGEAFVLYTDEEGKKFGTAAISKVTPLTFDWSVDKEEAFDCPGILAASFVYFK